MRCTSSKGLRLTMFWLVVCLVVAFDQATKAAVRVALPAGGKTLIPGVLDLVHVENTGAAFSLGRGAGALFAIVAVVVLVVATLVVQRHDLPISLVVSIGFVAGGGVGNMIDRLMQGSVTDFFATTFMDFPVFNVADVFVTVGVVLTFIGFLVRDARSGKKDESQR
ncbi:MAG: signal peptidase II [Atopobiaceae bacterium]